MNALVHELRRAFRRHMVSTVWRMDALIFPSRAAEKLRSSERTWTQTSVPSTSRFIHFPPKSCNFKQIRAWKGRRSYFGRTVRKKNLQSSNIKVQTCSFECLTKILIRICLSLTLIVHIFFREYQFWAQKSPHESRIWVCGHCLPLADCPLCWSCSRVWLGYQNLQRICWNQVTR